MLAAYLRKLLVYVATTAVAQTIPAFGQPRVKPARHPQSMSHLALVPLYPVNTRSSFINKSNQLRESRRR